MNILTPQIEREICSLGATPKRCLRHAHAVAKTFWGAHLKLFYSTIPEEKSHVCAKIS